MVVEIDCLGSFLREEDPSVAVVGQDEVETCDVKIGKWSSLWLCCSCKCNLWVTFFLGYGWKEVRVVLGRAWESQLF